MFANRDVHGEEAGQIRIFQLSDNREMDCARGIVNRYVKGSPDVLSQDGHRGGRCNSDINTCSVGV